MLLHAQVQTAEQHMWYLYVCMYCYICGIFDDTCMCGILLSVIAVCVYTLILSWKRWLTATSRPDKSLLQYSVRPSFTFSIKPSTSVI